MARFLDGQLVLALRRLVLPPIYFLSRSLGTVAPGTLVYSVGSGNVSGCLASGLVLFLSFFLSLAGGGFGLWLLNPLWVAYWRQREFVADDYAKQLELSGPLRAFLEQHKVQDVAAPYFLSEAPSSELRIDRLDHGPETKGAMPWPKRETTVLFGSLAVLLLVGFFSFGGRGVLGLTPKPDGEWDLSKFALGDRPPDTPASAYGTFHLTLKGGQAQAFSRNNGYGAQKVGTYHYLDPNTIEFDWTYSDQGMPYNMNGQYTFSKQKVNLFLRGSYEQFEFAPYSAITPTSVPTNSPSQTSTQTQESLQVVPTTTLPQTSTQAPETLQVVTPTLAEASPVPSTDAALASAALVGKWVITKPNGGGSITFGADQNYVSTKDDGTVAERGAYRLPDATHLYIIPNNRSNTLFEMQLARESMTLTNQSPLEVIVLTKAPTVNQTPSPPQRSSVSQQILGTWQLVQPQDGTVVTFKLDGVFQSNKWPPGSTYAFDSGNRLLIHPAADVPEVNFVYDISITGDRMQLTTVDSSPPKIYKYMRK